MNAIHMLRHGAGTIVPKLRLVTLMMFLPLASPGGGVVTECTEASLRSAMAGGGTVTFACDGTIPLASTITNELNTTVDATGHQITISGGNLVRVFYVRTNTSLTLIHLSTAYGRSWRGSGVYNDGGTLNLVDVRFETNVAIFGAGHEEIALHPQGGALFNRGGSVSGTRCTFAGNLVHQPFGHDPDFPLHAQGGAICNETGAVNLQQCCFRENVARGGPSMINSQFSGASGFGGAIYNAGNLTLEECNFLQDTAMGGLGNQPSAPVGYYPGWPGTSGGNADGGALWSSGNLWVRDCSFVSNAVSGGGGGAGGPGGTDGMFYGKGGAGGNGGVARGGAIFNSGTASLANNTFGPGTVAVGGAAGPGAGGVSSIYASGGGLGGMGGEGEGAALFNQGTMMMMNCTVTSNTVTGGQGGGGGDGGTGIKSTDRGGNGGNGGEALGVVASRSDLFLTNCSVARNHASIGLRGSGGAGGTRTLPEPYQAPSGLAGTNGFAAGGVTGLYITLVNTLLAGNAPVGNWSGSAPIDGGHNLSSDNTCAFTHAGSLSNTDPRLGPLRNNGGPTLTMALLPDSPAIDAGDNMAAPPADQRGIPRPFGSSSDIGAYEYATLLRITRATDNNLDLVLHDGVPGAMCRLLTSTNLTHWQSVATNQVLLDGTTVFQDSLNKFQALQFYRAVWP